MAILRRLGGCPPRLASTVNGLLTAADVRADVRADVSCPSPSACWYAVTPNPRSWACRRACRSATGGGVGALVGSPALLAEFLLSAAAFAAGTLLATGPPVRRTTMGEVACVRNAGPAPAAIGITFKDQPAVLGALAAILLSGLAAALPIAALLSSRRSASTAAKTEMRTNGRR
ncbi:hypothetical protein GCM10018980_16060 [Streptomyces capoamus]|uniref:Uncharacterized protein n=1 Tax=Streptomyces capoamus TaxID=68183 RepID=A0A919C1Z9_9ACTN|nr:hypothetical protein [Streptomyces capoamus]GGW13679.1 hypothetical protein GCM10010501_18470 [Streptomyces libani subsp. rufus]GHG41155.1 hypothetical protein GCM10018980_16060 [Streptomyces capoamus]